MRRIWYWFREIRLQYWAASLAAFYRRIPVGHVEAGLRTGNRYSPFPEEMNRLLASRLATLHFAPTERARKNLLEEKIPESDISVTGNTVIDALHIALNRLDTDPDAAAADGGGILPSESGAETDSGHRVIAGKITATGFGRFAPP